MYGKDKVGKWGVAWGSPLRFRLCEPPAGRGSLALTGWARLPSGLRTAPQAYSAVPRSLETHAAEARKGGGISRVGGVRPAAGGGGGEMSAWSSQEGGC